MRHVFWPRFLVVLIAGCLAWASSQPWKSADPATWSADDVNHILADSPWSEDTGATFALAAEEAPPPPAIEVPQAGMPSPHNAATDGRWDGGVGRVNRNRTPTLNVNVRWDSALPVRLALERAHTAPPYTPAQWSRSYIITVTGLVPGRQYGQPKLDTRSADGVDTRNPEEMLESVLRYSHLSPRGRPSIAAADVKLDTESGALHLFFPRNPPITKNDKEIIFQTRFGSLSVSSTFRLKTMQFRGQLEL